VTFQAVREILASGVRLGVQDRLAMIIPGYASQRLLWLTKCLLFCLLGIFIAGRLSDFLNPLIWWVLHRNGTTFLQCPLFIAHYYLPLVGTYAQPPIRPHGSLIASFLLAPLFFCSPTQLGFGCVMNSHAVRSFPMKSPEAPDSSCERGTKCSRNGVSGNLPVLTRWPGI
jgi:hypothetical protein